MKENILDSEYLSITEATIYVYSEQHNICGTWSSLTQPDVPINMLAPG